MVFMDERMSTGEPVLTVDDGNNRVHWNRKNGKTTTPVFMHFQDESDVKKLREHMEAAAKDNKQFSLKDRLADAAAKTDQNPTEGQKKAGNYQKGRVSIHDMRVSIENPRGSIRTGPGWEREMMDHYGQIIGTEGADGDPVDVFIGRHPESEIAFVVDQVDQSGNFDECKVILGAISEKHARQIYSRNYPRGWRCGTITPMTIPEFREWVKSRKAKKPAAGKK